MEQSGDQKADVQLYETFGLRPKFQDTPPPRTVAQLSRYGAPLPRSELRTGDLVLFGSAVPTHAGIYVGNNRFVHAPSTGGTVRLDSLDGPYWSRQVATFRRP